MSPPNITRLFSASGSAAKRARREDTPAPGAREPELTDAHPFAAWVASMDKFIDEQSTASKAAAWLTPSRHRKAVDQGRLCRTFRGSVSQKKVDKGYCFALTALWLHEAAHGRSEHLMQKLQDFCGARSPLKPRKARREQLRRAMTPMEALNRRQHYGAHALDASGLHRQKTIIGHIDATELVELMIQNSEHHGLWEISSANHTIGAALSRKTCVVYDPNDPDGAFEATSEDKKYLIEYLQHALRFPQGIGEQPITLTAFAPRPRSEPAPTQLAGVSQDNVNRVAPAGKSVADMTLHFMPARALLGLVTRFDVPMAREQLPMLACLIGVDRTYHDVLVTVLRSAPAVKSHARAAVASAQNTSNG